MYQIVSNLARYTWCNKIKSIFLRREGIIKTQKNFRDYRLAISRTIKRGVDNTEWSFVTVFDRNDVRLLDDSGRPERKSDLKEVSIRLLEGVSFRIFKVVEEPTNSTDMKLNNLKRFSMHSNRKYNPWRNRKLTNGDEIAIKNS